MVTLLYDSEVEVLYTFTVADVTGFPYWLSLTIPPIETPVWAGVVESKVIFKGMFPAAIGENDCTSVVYPVRFVVTDNNQPVNHPVFMV